MIELDGVEGFQLKIGFTGRREKEELVEGARHWRRESGGGGSGPGSSCGLAAKISPSQT
jgi:hypothetical protein